MKALIFAAGLGTRLKNLTTHIPKALVEVKGKPMLQLTIERLKAQGIQEFVINIHHFGDKILEFLEAKHNFNCKIDISDEREQLLDTGGGLKKAEQFLKKEDCFLIHNTDIFSETDIRAMKSVHRYSESLVTMAVQDRSASRKLGFDNKNRLQAWKNFNSGETIFVNPSHTYLNYFAFSGIHIVSNKIFPLLPPIENYPIIPEYLRLAKNHTISAFEHCEPVFDMGTPERIRLVEKYLRT